MSMFSFKPCGNSALIVDSGTFPLYITHRKDTEFPLWEAGAPLLKESPGEVVFTRALAHAA